MIKPIKINTMKRLQKRKKISLKPFVVFFLVSITGFLAYKALAAYALTDQPKSIRISYMPAGTNDVITATQPSYTFGNAPATKPPFTVYYKYKTGTTGAETQQSVTPQPTFAFKSWNTKQDGTGTSIEPGKSIKDFAELPTFSGDTLTLYETWTKPSVSLPTTLAAYTGYVLDGWSKAATTPTLCTDKIALGDDVPTSYYAGMSGAGNGDNFATFYACYVALPDTQHRLIFNKNGGASAPGPVVGNKSATVQILAATPKAITLSLDYQNGGGSSSVVSQSIPTTFKGWTTAKSGSGTVHSGSYTLPSSTGGTLLYAQYIYYTAAGYLPVDDPVRPGYDFDKWYTKSNGGGTAITGNYEIKETQTFYANWTPKDDYPIEGKIPYKIHQLKRPEITINRDYEAGKVRVMLDSTELTLGANYAIRHGSTIISLFPGYLDTLSLGEHDITVVFEDENGDKYARGILEILAAVDCEGADKDKPECQKPDDLDMTIRNSPYTINSTSPAVTAQVNDKYQDENDARVWINTQLIECKPPSATLTVLDKCRLSVSSDDEPDPFTKVEFQKSYLNTLSADSYTVKICLEVDKLCGSETLVINAQSSGVTMDVHGSPYVIGSKCPIFVSIRPVSPSGFDISKLVVKIDGSTRTSSGDDNNYDGCTVPPLTNDNGIIALVPSLLDPLSEGDHILQVCLNLTEQCATSTFVIRSDGSIILTLSNPSYTLNSNTMITAVVNKDYTSASEVQVFADDNKLLYATDYFLSHGSTNVTFTAKFLNSLKVGDREIKVTFSDGKSATGTLEVLAALAEGNKGDKGDTGGKGDAGAQGPIGDTGNTGAQGPAGRDGIDAGSGSGNSGGSGGGAAYDVPNTDGPTSAPKTGRVSFSDPATAGASGVLLVAVLLIAHRILKSMFSHKTTRLQRRHRR